MNSELTALINIGPHIAELIKETGVMTVAQFNAADPYLPLRE